MLVKHSHPVNRSPLVKHSLGPRRLEVPEVGREQLNSN